MASKKSTVQTNGTFWSFNDAVKACIMKSTIIFPLFCFVCRKCKWDCIPETWNVLLWFAKVWKYEMKTEICRMYFMRKNFMFIDIHWAKYTLTHVQISFWCRDWRKCMDLMTLQILYHTSCLFFSSNFSISMRHIFLECFFLLYIPKMLTHFLFNRIFDSIQRKFKFHFSLTLIDVVFSLSMQFAPIFTQTVNKWRWKVCSRLNSEE